MMLCWILRFTQTQARSVPILPVSYDVAVNSTLGKDHDVDDKQIVLNTWFNLVHSDMIGFRKSAHKMLTFMGRPWPSWFRILLAHLCTIAFWIIVAWPMIAWMWPSLWYPHLISPALHGDIPQRISPWVLRRKKEFKAIPCCRFACRTTQMQTDTKMLFLHSACD